MAEHTDKNAALNVVGAFLATYGLLAQLLFLILLKYWESALPKAYDSMLGYNVPHNEHGSITYFSKFEGTSCNILFFTSVPILFLGVFLVPKKGNGGARWVFNDPLRLRYWGFLSGAMAAPLIIFGLGPPFVRWLNTNGIAWSF